jgi:lysozyme family protein
MSPTPNRPMNDFEKAQFGRWQSSSLTTDTELLRELNLVVDTILKNQARYEAVGKPFGIPFYVLGCLHYRESSSSFNRHLHNGDPLTARTVHVPPGRPVNGAPPFTWEESAADALTLRGYANLTGWDLVHCLVRCEAWNGYGYKNRNVPSPYVWSFTSAYSAGKFVADGKYDPTAVDAQPGCAAILKALVIKGVQFDVVVPS